MAKLAAPASVALFAHSCHGARALACSADPGWFSARLGTPATPDETLAPHSFLCGIRRLQDGRPAVDLCFHESAELRWRALALGRDRSSELGELRRHAAIVQGFVERDRQFVDDWLRRAFGRENPSP